MPDDVNDFAEVITEEEDDEAVEEVYNADSGVPFLVWSADDMIICRQMVDYIGYALSAVTKAQAHKAVRFQNASLMASGAIFEGLCEQLGITPTEALRQMKLATLTPDMSKVH